MQNTITHGWSRNVLTHQIESNLWQREGNAVSNFTATLPKVQSDLAQQTLKDPYDFDFLTLSKSYNEREVRARAGRAYYSIPAGAGRRLNAYMGKEACSTCEWGKRDFYY